MLSLSWLQTKWHHVKQQQSGCVLLKWIAKKLSGNSTSSTFHIAAKTTAVRYLKQRGLTGVRYDIFCVQRL